jgi:hypothetical protein
MALLYGAISSAHLISFGGSTVNPLFSFYVLAKWLIRLKDGLPLNPYDRSRFYGPFPDREVSYTGYPTWEEA